MIDSVFRTGKNYYPQVFLQECKYFVKEKYIHKNIIYDIEISSDSDEENSCEKSLKNTNITHILKLIFEDHNKYLLFAFLYIKTVNKYYQKNKEKLRKEAPERHQNLYEKENEKKHQHHRDPTKNLPEEEKEKKVEYMRNYYLAHNK